MAARLIERNGGTGVESWIGLTADTAAWLAANTGKENGSTYREMDGEKRMYQILDGTWYEL